MRPLYWPNTACTSATRAIEHESMLHEHHVTDRAAAEAFMRVLHMPPHERPRYLCITGPGGLVRGVEGVWLGVVSHDESIPLEHRPPAYAECQGPNDPFCGRCRLSVHGCNDAQPRAVVAGRAAA